MYQKNNEQELGKQYFLGLAPNEASPHDFPSIVVWLHGQERRFFKDEFGAYLHLLGSLPSQSTPSDDKNYAIVTLQMLEPKHKESCGMVQFSEDKFICLKTTDENVVNDILQISIQHCNENDVLTYVKLKSARRATEKTPLIESSEPSRAGVINDVEKQNYIPRDAEASFIRWALRNQMFDKLLIYGFQEPFPGWFSERLRHRIHYFFRAGAIPVKKSKLLRPWQFFLQRAYWITDTVWPLSLIALIAHDLILKLADPKEIFGGYAEEFNLWSIRFSDLPPDDPYYWLGPAGFIALPILFGLTNMALRSLGDCCSSPQSTQYTLTYQSSFRDWITSLVPSVFFGSFQRALSRATFAVLYDRSINGSANRKAYFKCIKKLAKNHNGFARWQAMASLATIADSFNDDSLRCGNINPNALQKIGDKAELILSSAKQSYNPVTWLYSRYLLASIGEEKGVINKVVWGTVAIGALLVWIAKLYAKARGVQMVYNAGRFAYDYFTGTPALPLCELIRPVLAYLPTFGEKECTVCGNWSQMFSGDVFDPESCAKGLFQINRSPQELIKHLRHLAHFPLWTVADLSQQTWSAWTDEEFASVLDALAQSPQITTLNLARPVSDRQGLSEAKAASLSRFIQRMRLTHVSLANQLLGPTEVRLLSQGFANSTLIDLNLSHCVADGQDLAPVIEVLPSMSRCRSVNLAGNYLRDAEVKQLCNVGPHTSIVMLDLSENTLIGQEGFSTIGATLPRWHLTHLLFSKAYLKNIDMEPFWQGVGGSSLVECHIVACHLTNDQLLMGVPYLAQSNLTTINLSDNAGLTDTGFVNSLYGLRSSQIQNYDFSKVAITNRGLHSVSAFWSEMKACQSINLSSGSFDASGFSEFIRAPQPQNFRVLIATDNNLTDIIASDVVNLIGNRNNTLHTLDLSRNRLTDKTGVPLGHSLLNSPLERLIVQGNYFTGNTTTAISVALSQRRLIYVDLSYNPLTNIGPFAKELANSTVQTLVLQNALSGNDYNILFDHLITPRPAIPANESITPSESLRQRFAKANATTAIQHLIVPGRMTDEQATLGCLVRYPSHIADFQMQQPNTNGSVNVVTCTFPTSASSTLQSVSLSVFRYLQQKIWGTSLWFSERASEGSLSDVHYLDSDERAFTENSPIDWEEEAEEMEALLSSLSLRTNALSEKSTREGTHLVKRSIRRWTEERTSYSSSQFFLPEPLSQQGSMTMTPIALPGAVQNNHAAPGLALAMGSILVSGGIALIIVGAFFLLCCFIRFMLYLMEKNTQPENKQTVSNEIVSWNQNSHDRFFDEDIIRDRFFAESIINIGEDATNIRGSLKAKFSSAPAFSGSMHK